ncbi:hypothetical protein Lnau_0482 [Legionella nautarum]|uniref:Uncharacterized protein n=1 Tax=Legionella nautarum TaxID=45070 RepID=A0A0W0X244_9GAMM|nr:hypothetical protein Lnau_0482 [Legionella nautarum]
MRAPQAERNKMYTNSLEIHFVGIPQRQKTEPDKIGVHSSILPKHPIPLNSVFSALFQPNYSLLRDQDASRLVSSH